MTRKTLCVPNAGASLEDLVSEIEGYLLGEGFDVSSRVQVFDDEGLQTAELDVEVVGRVGSSSVRWVFECRDRPSDGPAGVAWIEQLAGRRSRLRVDKMFAVSTTGFSAQARNLAEEQGIVLRTVAQLSDVQEEFMVKQVALIEQRISKVGAAGIRAEDGSRAASVRMRDPRYRRVGTSEWQTVSELLSDAMPEPKVELEYPHVARRVFLTEAPYEIQHSGTVIRTVSLRIPYEITTECVVSRALTGRIYAEGAREIGREGAFEFETPLGKVSLRIQLFPAEDGQTTFRAINDSKHHGTRFHGLIIHDM